jgi:hypothetical protein
MKKVYISFFGMLVIGVSALAQKHNAPALTAKKFESLEIKAPKGNIATTKGITLWSNDFSNPAQWTPSNFPAATPPHTSGDWAITTNLNAVPVTALKPAGFTTAANGYALINSDAAGANATQNARIVYNQNIDLTGEPDVLLIFQHSHRRFMENTYVVYSTNGGNSWQEIEVNGAMATNTNTTNPATIQLNLSNEIGNQDSVRIGFKYTGAFDWFWAVDDVKITTPDDFDLAVTGIYWGSTGPWGARLPYYQIPTAQVTAIDFSGIVTNLGAQNQTVTFGLQAGAYSGTSAPMMINAFAFDTVPCTASFTPPATVANYTVNAGVQSANIDANPADNTVTNAATIAVNQNIYARDLDNVASGSFNQGMGFEVGNIFDMYAGDDLSAIDVYIHPNANVGTEMYVKLYSIDPATGDFVYVDESAPYTLTANEIDALITLPLQGGAFTLNANESYLVVAGSNGDGGATDDLVVGTCGVSEAQTSYYYDMTNTTWYYTTSTPMVRMNFSNANIAENSLLNAFEVYPNPANGNTTVSISGNTNGSVAVSMMDISGKVVYQNTLTSLNGTSTLTVNTEKLSNGLYTVNVMSNGVTSTKKVVVKN